MIRLFSLSLLFIAASGSIASACSIMPPPAATESSYEDILSQYPGGIYRTLVNNSENILVGKFKYSKKRKAHQLIISEYLKSAEGSKNKKKVSISFKNVTNDRVDYIRQGPDEFVSYSIDRMFGPLRFEPQLEGSYGPGDCGVAIELLADQDYIVFADEDFVVKTTFLLEQSAAPLLQSFKNLIKDPYESKGIAYSLRDFVKSQAPVSLFETSICSPQPIYRVLGTTLRKANFKSYEATPIIGQKFLSIGDIFYETDGTITGQMIRAEDGYFDLSDTLFENYFSPGFVSVDDVSKLLTESVD